MINWILSILGAIAGFLMRTLWQSVKDLQESDKNIVSKIYEVDKLVAGQYVRRDELTSQMAAMFKKLDRIEDKLDHKVDK